MSPDALVPRLERVPLLPYAAMALAVAVAVAGCGDTPTRAEMLGVEDSTDLADRTFVSTEVRGHDLVEGTTVTLTFDTERISATAGCNTLNGAASWDDGTLSVDEPLAGTMMACPPELEGQDEWLRQLLTSSPEIALDGSVLTVGDDASGITLEEEES